MDKFKLGQKVRVSKPIHGIKVGTVRTIKTNYYQDKTDKLSWFISTDDDAPENMNGYYIINFADRLQPLTSLKTKNLPVWW